MRLIYILLCSVSIFVLSPAKAQNGDWSPFLNGMKNIYWNQNTGEIIPIKIDSIKIENGTTYFGVWQKEIKSLMPSCDSAFQLGGEFNSLQNLETFPFFSFIQSDKYEIWHSNDSNSVIRLPLRSDFEQPFYINNTVKMVLDTYAILNVLGMQDSVANFQLFESSSNEYLGLLKWSKSFGLIEFPSFPEMNYSQGIAFETYFSIIASKNGNQQLGIDLPHIEYFLKPSSSTDKQLFEIEYSGVTYFPIELSVPSCKELQEHNNGSVYYYKLNGISKTSSCYSSGFSGLINPFEGDLDDQLFSANYLNGSVIILNRLYYNGVKFELKYEYTFGDCQGSFIDAVQFSGTLIKDFGFSVQAFYGGYNGGDGTRKLKAAITSEGNYGTWPINLGLYDLETNDIRVYPNPSNTGVFNVDYDGPFHAKVYDSLGRLVVETDKGNINLQQQADGIYFLEIETNQRTKTLKLVKQ